MEAIIAAAITAASQLVQLIFLGFKANGLTDEEIEEEIKRIMGKQKELIKKWWDVVNKED